jgi:transcriptional regulator with XRE-family HTH domain
VPLLTELATFVRQRRQAMGLSQQQVADLAGLSRATVNALESGKLENLSATRLERLANELGFAVGVVGTRRAADTSAIEAAARVASVPYKTVLPAHVLFESMRDGAVPPGYIPQLRNLLQEAPMAVLADLADELERVHRIPAADSWQRMRALAGVLKCDRRIWQRST